MPKIHNVPQGTEAWLKLRMGIPTASEFHKIVTPTGALSKQSEEYLHRLLAEILLGKPLAEQETKWMERGHELEPEAVLAYELHTGVSTEVAGFVTNDEGTIGASPDRFIGEDGLLEIKCPAPATHIGYMHSRKVDKEKMPQLQGQLYVTGRKWVDVLSYHPELSRVIIRVERDEKYIATLHTALTTFVNDLANLRIELERDYINNLDYDLQAIAAGREFDKMYPD